MDAFILNLAAHYPFLLTVVAIMGSLRVILKPTFSFLHTVMGAIGYQKGDQDVTLVEQSTAIKWLTYALDWVASVKLTTPTVAVVPAATQLVTPAPAADDKASSKAA